MKTYIYFLLLIIPNYLTAECSDLNQADCLYWSEYCEWNNETSLCQEIGGGNGGDNFGPFQVTFINESDGLRNGPHYRDGTLYYPIEGTPPFQSIVITPGWGGNSASMGAWGEFFASHGFIALTIGPNDEINDSHQMRAEGLLDGIETIRVENERQGSPLFGSIDIENYSVCGYSMGGGAAQIAAVMDNSITSVISLNPTVIFEDCDLCSGFNYCICLVPEMLDHPVPTLIFAGQNEIDELPSYDGLLGQDQYTIMPESTDKIMFEGANSGHGFAANPQGEIAEYILVWSNYQILGDVTSCEALLETPESASQYLTNLSCEDILLGDVNNDGLINVIDIISTVNLILSNEYLSMADMNSDNGLNVLDIVAIVNVILGVN